MGPLVEKAEARALLGVEEHADVDTIRAAYRRLARQAHPDAGGTDALFVLVEQAYQLLTDTAADGSQQAAGQTADGDDGHVNYTSTPPTGAGTYQAPYDEPAQANGRPANSQTGSTSGPETDPAHGPDDGPTGPPPSTVGPTVVGTPSAVTAHGSAGQVGIDAERRTATILATAGLPASAFVFHDVVPPGGAGNIDHVVIVDGRVLIFDTKRWGAGIYHYDRDAGEAWRDGRRFKAGDVGNTAWLMSHLHDQLDVNEDFHGCLVIDGPTAEQLLDYDHPRLWDTPQRDLPGWLAWYRDRIGTSRAAFPLAALLKLHSWTTQPAMQTSHIPPPAPLNPDAVVSPTPREADGVRKLRRCAYGFLGLMALYIVELVTPLLLLGGWFGALGSFVLAAAIHVLHEEVQDAYYTPAFRWLRQLAGEPATVRPGWWTLLPAPPAGIVLGSYWAGNLLGEVAWLGSRDLGVRLIVTLAIYSPGILILATMVRWFNKRRTEQTLNGKRAAALTASWTRPDVAPYAAHLLRSAPSDPTIAAIRNALAADPANEPFLEAVDSRN